MRLIIFTDLTFHKFRKNSVNKIFIMYPEKISKFTHFFKNKQLIDRIDIEY